MDAVATHAREIRHTFFGGTIATADLGVKEIC